MRSKPLLLSITPFVPYEGIDHAGGEYVLTHLRILSERFRIALIAPETPTNLNAAEVLPPFIEDLILIPDAGDGRARRAITVLYKGLLGTAFDPWFSKGLRNNSRARALASVAAAIDFQWAQSAHFSRGLRSLNKNATHVLVAHDILTQRWRRASSTASNRLERTYYRLRAMSAFRSEQRLFAAVDCVVTFSAEDAERARTISSAARVVAVRPPLAGPSMPVDDVAVSDLISHRSSPTILFTGAMSRPENDDAIKWFIREIWPRVLALFENAQLVIAGANPSAELKNLAGPKLSVTGYVDNLGAIYRDARVFIVPLRRGAGVKFKTITAMLWGLPVVSSPVGAEGVGDIGQYLAVTVDPDEFAAAVVEGLRDSPRSIELIRSNARWARAEFGQENLRRDLTDVYLSP